MWPQIWCSCCHIVWIFFFSGMAAHHICKRHKRFQLSIFLYAYFEQKMAELLFQKQIWVLQTNKPLLRKLDYKLLKKEHLMVLCYCRLSMLFTICDEQPSWELNTSACCFLWLAKKKHKTDLKEQNKNDHVGQGELWQTFLPLFLGNSKNSLNFFFFF